MNARTGIVVHPMAAARHARGWSQGELARRSGVNLETISNIERGKSLPYMPTRRRLLRAFGKALSLHNYWFGPRPRAQPQKPS